MERADHQVEQMQAPEAEGKSTVNAVSRRKTPRHGHAAGPAKPKPKKQPAGNRGKEQERTCYSCGGQYPHEAGCPAEGQTCGNCGKQNHYASVCRQGKPFPGTRRNPRHRSRRFPPKSQQNAVNQVGTNQSSDDEWVFTLAAHHVHAITNQEPKVGARIDGTPVTMLLDSGASVNLLDPQVYNAILSRNKQLCLQPADTRVFVYGSKKPLPVAGKFQAQINIGDACVEATFYVTHQNAGNILSYQTGVALGMIHIPKEHINAVSAQRTHPILDEFKDVFTGVGKLKEYQQRIHIDRSVKPVAQSPRRVPFHVRKQVEEQLDDLEASGIIEAVEGPTPWVSPIVVIPKRDRNKVRICVDMRSPNTAVRRERHPMPTLDEIIHDLNGAKVFSKLDLNQAYHQIELHPDSRYITTFVTHKGLRRYTRLMFGLSSASEIFQHIVQQVLSGIQGVKNISDDIIVFGATQEEHDRALRATLQRLREKGLTLNKSKCVFNTDQMIFHGHTFLKDGVSPDPQKIEAICNMPPPTDPGEVRSLLGMTGYVARFIPNYATITEPLKILTRKDTPWEWSKHQQDALNQLKHHLTQNPVIAYFNPTKKVEIVVDASPVGVGAVFTQFCEKPDGSRTAPQVVAYASRTLTDTERRYSQTEREALAIVWACERFHLYVFGTNFTVVTDHKPLVPMFNNPKSTLPARVERLRLRTSSYTMKVEYRPGAENPADFLSRHPLPKQSTSDRNAMDDYVNYIMDNAVPRSLTQAEIQEATQKDATMQKLKQFIQSGCWNQQDQDLKSFYKIRHEFSMADDIILRGCRIVLPAAMREKVLQLAHEGHQGIVKTKRLLRQKVWYPNIDQDAEKLISGCIPCQATGPTSKPEPLQMSDLPARPWTQLCADFYGPLPTGEYILVVLDEYSRYPEVDIVKSTSAESVIPKMDRMFATHGIPEQVKTDNGPPFQGEHFARFSEIKGFHHRKITPCWPKANSEAERFMRTMGKSIKTSVAEGRNWRKELNQFMLNYRATPHSTTGVSPAELLFNRPLRTKLPALTASVDPDDSIVRQRDANAKAKMKQYSDAATGAKPSVVKEGDVVLVRQQRHNKLSPTFSVEPHRVVRKKGSMLTLENPGGKRFSRNSSFVKKVPEAAMHRQGATVIPEEEDDDDVFPDQQQPRQQPAPAAVRRNPPRERRPPTRFLEDIG